MATAPTPTGPVRPDEQTIEARIVSTTFPENIGTMTLCVLTLTNGFTVSGESACLDPAMFDSGIGQQIARDNAVQKVWALECYLAAETWFLAQPKAS